MFNHRDLRSDLDDHKLAQLLYNTIISTGEYEPRSYSGRGMYGDACLAVYTDESMLQTLANIVDCLIYNSLFDADDAPETFRENLDAISWFIKNAKYDSMGLGTVLYWPLFPWNDDWNKYEQEEE